MASVRFKLPATCRLVSPKGISIAFTAVFLMAVCTSLHAVQFAVDSTDDLVDSSPGDGVCSAAGNVCTLRAAVMEANALPGPDTIRLFEAEYALTLSPLPCGEASNIVYEDACGDLDITSEIEIIGSGAYRTFIDADGISGFNSWNNIHFDVAPGAIFTVRRLFLTGASGQGPGGALRARDADLLIDNVFFYSNQSLISGGAMDVRDGTTEITDSIFRSNLLVGDASAHLGGGAIFHENSEAVGATTFQVVDSTFTGNRTGFVGGNSQPEADDPHGGALYLGNEARALLHQVTLDANHAAGRGGGLYVHSLANIVIVNGATIVDNVADEDNDAGNAPGGGGFAIDFDLADPFVSVLNTIVAFNSEANDIPTSFNPDCYGEFEMNHSLLSNTANCDYSGANNLLNADPLIDVLGDTGGPVPTIALMAGSPAIDAGDNSNCGGTDARGLFRSINLVCDMGAWEFGHQPTFSPKVSVDGEFDFLPTDGRCEGIELFDAITVCTLRGAVREAVGLAQPSALIKLSSHTFVLDIAGEGEDEGKTGDLDIASPGRITFAGVNARSSVIDASGLGDRIFDLDPLGNGTAAGFIQDLSLVGGGASTVPGGNVMVHGGELRLARVTVDSGTASNGGGLAVIAPVNPAVVDIDSTTFSNNNANSLIDGYGGAMFLSGMVDMSMENSTLTLNRANRSGGGIRAESSDVTIGLDYVTIHANEADQDHNGGEGGGISTVDGPNVNVSNTAMTLNSAFNGELEDCGGNTLNSLDYNVSSTGGCGFDEPHDQNGTQISPLDPLFDVFGSRGGPTDTLLPMPASPLINAANPAGCGGEDQRGEPRPQGGACDVGAVEAPDPGAEEIFSDNFEG